MPGPSDGRPFSGIDSRTILFWAIGISVGLLAGQYVFGGSLWRTVVAAVSAIVILLGYVILKEIK
ncbi:hypothetical protein [Natrarchaeobius halalkaliphilus]|uniref:hypothetical protein n=1 Tax=Natrarchaeobius halalkaliphilus TaxID=1679091 RepID=UPI000F54BF08|nr:hypothetical protein [Natrarchaeobius halalkaliphilus]